MDGAANEAVRKPAAGEAIKEGAAFVILGALSFSHLLNDMLSSLVPAIYPILKEGFDLDFAQIGLITLSYQITASLLQPLVGLYTDHRPKPYLLPVGMALTLAGLVVLAYAGNFLVLLAAAALIGVGSSVFHPESSRMARLASGGQHGLAQSLFQVGGNAGQALGPLAAAFIIVPHGQSSLAWFSVAALLAIVILMRVGNWSQEHLRNRLRSRRVVVEARPALSRRRVGIALAVLLALIFSKYFYLAGLNSYYTFYLIDKFHVSVQGAQIYLFVFMGAVAAGTIIGGPLGDRFGRKYIIWGSILGVLPFTVALPYADLAWTAILSVLIGLIISSAFSVILVYAQELMPGKVGMVAGFFFGFAFGIAGIGAAVLGTLADATSIEFVYKVCSFLPAIGILTVFLPNLESVRSRRAKTALQ